MSVAATTKYSVIRQPQGVSDVRGKKSGLPTSATRRLRASGIPTERSLRRRASERLSERRVRLHPVYLSQALCQVPRQPASRKAQGKGLGRWDLESAGRMREGPGAPWVLCAPLPVGSSDFRGSGPYFYGIPPALRLCAWHFPLPRAAEVSLVRASCFVVWAMVGVTGMLWQAQPNHTPRPNQARFFLCWAVRTCQGSTGSPLVEPRSFQIAVDQLQGMPPTAPVVAGGRQG